MRLKRLIAGAICGVMFVSGGGIGDSVLYAKETDCFFLTNQKCDNLYCFESLEEFEIIKNDCDLDAEQTKKVKKINHYEGDYEDYNVFEESWDYDEKGRLVGWLDFPVEIYSEYEYDENDNEIKCTEYHLESKISETKKEYDDNGKLIKKTDYGRDGEIWRTQSYEYDANGNVILEKQTLDDSINKTSLLYYGYIEYSYYDNDICKSSCVYDFDDKIMRKIENDEYGNRTLYAEYNSDGNISSGKKNEYSYNSNDKKIKEVSELFNSEKKDWEIESSSDYKYDSNGNIISYTSYDSNGTINSCTEYTYDINGNEIKEIIYNGSIEKVSRVSLKDYYENGKLKKWTHKDGNEELLYYIEYEYDDDNDLLKTIKYDKDGNISSYDVYEYYEKDAFIKNDEDEEKSDDTKADDTKSDETKTDESKAEDKKLEDKSDKESTSNPAPIGNKYSTYENYDFYRDDAGDTRCYDSTGAPVINEFKCDGTYTYYFQLDGTAMKDRLSYHPDGVHVIYFDAEGHEVFSDFANVKKTIAGEDVNDFCFFNVFGYMYVDVLTYDKTGTYLYYANPYGVMEMGKWFQFSDTVKWADDTPAEGIAGGYGYANEDGTLMTNTQTVDWEGRSCYLQGNGVAAY